MTNRPAALTQWATDNGSDASQNPVKAIQESAAKCLGPSEAKQDLLVSIQVN
jgi:hypothetical protein